MVEQPPATPPQDTTARAKPARPRRMSHPVGGLKLTPLQNRLLGAAAIIGFVLIWWAASASGLVNPILLPTPGEVLERLIALSLDGTLLGHITASLSRVVAGFLIALAIALPVGIAMGMSPITRGLLEPLIELIRPIPPIAVIPLVMLWLGIDELSKMVIIAFGAFFPILVNTMAGFNAYEEIHVRAAQTLGASRFEIFRDVVLRAAFPYMVVGARVGMGLAFIVLVAAELIASSKGLGYLINDARYRFQTSEIFLGMATIGALGFLLNRLLIAVEKRVLRWRP